MTSLSEGNGNCKKPPGRPPPPLLSPAVNHPPHVKDETYRGSRRPNSRIHRQMARKKITSQQIIFNKIWGKGKQEKNDLLAYVPKRHPNTCPRKLIQNTLKIHRYLHNPTKKETSSAWAAAGKTEWQETNFMKLIISIRWIAITTENSTRNPPPQNLTHIKDDLSY